MRKRSIKNNFEAFEEDDFEDEIEDIDDEKSNLPAKKDDLYDDLYDDIGYGDFGSNFGGMPPAGERHNDLLKDLTNFDRYIRDTVNGWLGLIWDEKQQKYVRDQYSEPIMNKKCATWCIGYMRTYVKKNNIITHIGKNEYIWLDCDIIDVIFKNLFGRADLDFGIKNSGDILRVCTELQHSAELVLMGAGDGKYNELLSTATQRTENLSYVQPRDGMQQQSVQKANVLDKMKNFLTGRSL